MFLWCDVGFSSFLSPTFYNMKHPQATERHASSRVAELYLIGLGPSVATAPSIETASIETGLDAWAASGSFSGMKVSTKQARRGMEWKGRRPNGGPGPGQGQGGGSNSQLSAFKSLLMCASEWLIPPYCTPIKYHLAQINNPVKSNSPHPPLSLINHYLAYLLPFPYSSMSGEIQKQCCQNASQMCWAQSNNPVKFNRTQSINSVSDVRVGSRNID